MNKKKLLLIIFTTIFITIILFSILEIRTQFTRKLWDKYILDNRDHYLSCEELPSVEYINEVVNQNRDVLEDIIIEVGGYYRSEKVIPYWTDGSVQDGEDFQVAIFWGELYPECENTERGDILFTYLSSRDREIIEKLINCDTFKGIPYRLRNV